MGKLESEVVMVVANIFFLFLVNRFCFGICFYKLQGFLSQRKSSVVNCPSSWSYWVSGKLCISGPSKQKILQLKKKSLITIILVSV